MGASTTAVIAAGNAIQAASSAVGNVATSVANSTFADKLGGKVLGWVDAFEAVTKQYAPDVVKAALEVVRISCLNTLAHSWFYMLLSIALLVYGLKKLRSKAETLIEEDTFLDFVPVAAKVVSLIAGAILFLNNMGGVIDVWPYIGVIEPKVYVARMAMEKIVTLPDMAPPAKSK